MEGKVNKYKKPLISPKGAKNDNNSKQRNPLRSILYLLLLNILIRVPLCFYDVYITDGFFSRHFAVFALSAFVVLLMYALASKAIGANNENSPKKLEIHGVSLNLLMMLLNFIIAPLRLHEVYLTDGIFSRRFAHFALCALSLVFIHLKLSGIISSGPCMMLILPSFISLLATLELDLLYCVTMVGSFIFAIIIGYILWMYEKGSDKKADGKDISHSV